MAKNDLMLPDEIISSKIYLIREQKVMLDRDLAELYGVTTGNLNKAVKRNVKRFPDDFMFQLSKGGIRKFEIPIWNIKLGRNSHLALCFYRTGSCNAIRDIE